VAIQNTSHGGRLVRSCLVAARINVYEIIYQPLKGHYRFFKKVRK